MHKGILCESKGEHNTIWKRLEKLHERDNAWVKLHRITENISVILSLNKKSQGKKEQLQKMATRKLLAYSNDYQKDGIRRVESKKNC